jgi:flavodoxin
MEVDMGSKVLVAYFSRAGGNYAGGRIVDLAVGNTEVAATTVARLTGGDLFRIDPVKKYPQDYQACTEVAQEELDAGARPELTTYLDSVDGYDTVVLCYPNWWGTVPMPVCTFLERYSWTGTTILPLCTNEGSGMGGSEADIRKLCHGATVRAGLPIRGSKVTTAEQQITAWLKANGC